MDEVKRKRLQREIIQKLKQKDLYHDSFNRIINIYVDMLMQRDDLKKKILSYKGQAVDSEILTDSLDVLNKDILSYKKALCL